MVTEYDGDLVITGTDISKGIDYKYNYGEVMTILKSGTYTISMASGVSQTSDRIVVDADGDVELTISGINISNNDYSPFAANSGNLTLILDGDNYLTASSNTGDDSIYYAALSKPGDTYSLTIASIDGDGSSNGSLTASGGIYGAGIGGDNSTASGNITITSGIVNASSTNGAGIGGGYNGGGTNITIAGGTVTAAGYSSIGDGGNYTGTAEAVVIDGGSIKAENEFSTTPVNSNGENVYLYKIPDTTEGDTITVDGTTVIESVVHHSSDDANQYIYIPLDSACALSENSIYVLSYTKDNNETITTYVEKADKTIEIPDAATLSKFANIVKSGGNMINGIVTADIDFSGYTDMIGSSTYPYKGTFDGGGYTITVAYDITTAANNIGLFSYVDGGTIQNLNTEGYIDFTNTPKGDQDDGGYANIGGVAGYITNGTISNVVSGVDITATSYPLHNAGGIAGRFYQYSTIDKCMYTGSLTAYNSWDALGGIVGYTYQYCQITNSANLGTLYATKGTYAPYFGGILGYINNTTFYGIQNCYNYGSISADDTTYCGAIIGWLRKSSTNITNNYWLEGSAEKAFGTNGTSNTAPTASTADDFVGGSITYLLNGSTSEDAVWYQTLGTDSYPVFEGLTVYETVLGYSNIKNISDVWVDNVIDKKDAVAVLKYASGIYTDQTDNESIDFSAGDVNNDGSIDILDANAILKCLESGN